MSRLKNKKVDCTKRYSPDISKGLTDEQVKKRFAEGNFNEEKTLPTKTVPQIVFGNVCTLFNLLNFGLAIAVILVGSYENVLFMGVVLSNLFIGLIQEIRSKRIVDKLSIIASTKADVIRNGEKKRIPVNEIVLDDIITLKSGNQIVADCIIMQGSCDVNESFITGESDPIFKKQGDMLLSGSFVVSGVCTVKTEHIGEDNYVSQISSGAKYVKKVNSEILRTLKKIVKYISVFIIPVGLVLMYNQMSLEECTVEQAVVQTVAAIISLIPEGLMLLASTVLAVSVVRLSKYKVLVQELYCIETLARVDTLCLDKTGTLTEGRMEIKDVVVINEDFSDKIETALCSVVNFMQDSNPTFDAIREKYDSKTDWRAEVVCPFSSQTKWSGVFFQKHGTYILGAAEFVITDMDNKLKFELEKYAKDNRVLLMAHSDEPCADKRLPPERSITPVAFIVLRDKIRNEAKETLKYFADQGVDIKIISGDSVETVAGIAKHSGVDNWDNYIDATTLTTEKSLFDAANKYTVFGRVTPIQKKELVLAMKKQGHTVAMTGDGVNDVLALKEADCSIAMASGTDAARNVSQLVLLNSNFDSMPKVVAEGRRSINNIQRSAAIVMVRTIYAMILVGAFLFWQVAYPFIPIQQTLINSVSSGIPGIILALEPNKNRIKGNFLKNILRLSIPPAVAIGITVLIVMIVGYSCGVENKEISTVCVFVTGFIRLLFLYEVCVPFNNLRRILFFCMISIFIVGLTFFRSFFCINSFYNESALNGGINYQLIITTVVFVVLSLIIYKLSAYFCRGTDFVKHFSSAKNAVCEFFRNKFK